MFSFDHSKWTELHWRLVKVSQKFVFLFLVILMFDDLLEIGTWIFHQTFELFEYSIDLFIEHLLETSDTQSETIGFYIMLAFMLAITFYFLRVLPRLLLKFEKYLLLAWQGYKYRSSVYWHHLSFIEKTELSMTYFIEISFILFWLTM